MQVLSSYPTNNVPTDTKSATVANADAAESTTSSPKDSTTDTTDTKKTFSSRAEKFSQLNKEYDITGGSFKITSGFIQRLEELELLTPSQATELSGDLEPETQSTATLSDLSTNIDAIIKRVQDETGMTSLISILEKSQTILENLDGSQSKSFPIDPATAAAELDSFLKSDDADILTDKEKDSVKDLKLALSIADKLNPEQRTSAEVAKYMEILNRFR